MKYLVTLLFLTSVLHAQMARPVRYEGSYTMGVQGLRVERKSGTEVNIQVMAIPLYDTHWATGGRGETLAVSSVNVTVDSTVSGANGLAEGTSRSATAWYAILLIATPTGEVAGLIEDADEFALAHEVGTPDLPSGYDFFRRVAFCRTSSSDFSYFCQIDHEVSVPYASNLVQDALQGSTISTPDSCATYVPPSIEYVEFQYYGTGHGSYSHMGYLFIVADPNNITNGIRYDGMRMAYVDPNWEIRFLIYCLISNDSARNLWWAMQGTPGYSHLYVSGWYDPL